MKYKLTQETLEYQGHILHRIEALKDFGSVRKGDKGGFVESETNLSQDSNCWISGNAKVFDNAKVYNNAVVFDNAEIYGDAKVYGNAWVYDNTWVFGNAEVCGDSRIGGNADIGGDSKVERKCDYIVFKNWWSSGRYLTWTRSNNKWKVGCFYGTGEELIAKAYKDSELSGSEYKRLVDYVKSILQDEKGGKK